MTSYPFSRDKLTGDCRGGDRRPLPDFSSPTTSASVEGTPHKRRRSAKGRPQWSVDEVRYVSTAPSAPHYGNSGICLCCSRRSSKTRVRPPLRPRSLLRSFCRACRMIGYVAPSRTTMAGIGSESLSILPTVRTSSASIAGRARPLSSLLQLPFRPARMPAHSCTLARVSHSACANYAR